MQKLIQIDNADDYVIFFDSENHAYCMTHEVNAKQQEIKAEYDNDSKKVPSEITIKAYKLVKTGQANPKTEIYGIVEDDLIDYPICKIEWGIVPKI